MNNFLRRNRTSLSRLFVLMLVFFVCMQVQSDTVPLNFDRLFPETPLQGVLDSCMQVQGELDFWASEESTRIKDESLRIDAVVGRLFSVLSSIKNIVHQKIAIHVDDVDYLQHVIEHMSVVYKKLSSRGVPKEAVHIATLLQSIKQELKRLST